MRTFLRFLRATLMGGLLFLLPLTVVVIILEKAMALAHKIMVPLTEHVPFESFLGLPAPVFFDIAVLVAVCFAAGLVSRMAFAQRGVKALETKVLSNIPGYQLLKDAAESVIGADERSAHSAVLARVDDAWQIAIRVESHPNGMVTVFVPDAPNPLSGGVYFLPPDRVRPTTVPLAAAMKCLRCYGAGAGALVSGCSDESPAARPG